jgi:hypothetical protein
MSNTWKQNGLSRKENVRRVALICALSDMSRNGWDGHTCADWEPLERELVALNLKMTAH